ncbi:peptidoglycan-associated lipoprotein [Fontimonas thermophila]|uniref:Peptidoglycan-associated lipoprotein n=1 Tax=Fontimonas thermophila TaxID=1076937 RepID=A0A1I2HS95_9GAMM|nr:peptidoglycan-associated lipoprotein Pal [Fontimonas thermophila]SFF32180.1 peptidoglycan-associated lipoprotein [Fontimonas thermophila]
MNGKYWVPAVISVALMLGACGSTKERNPAGGTVPTQTSEPYTDRIAPAPAPVDGSYDAAAAAERALSTNIIYFDFDDSTIKPEYQGVIDAFASYLNANPTARVRLEGHADERGTREYNVGLGERRANAVQSALLAKGVSAQQISVISYGEERPADPGHDEAAWAKNRRVQIIRQ